MQATRHRSGAHPEGTRYRLIVTAVLISINWLIYVWSIANGHVIDASLGYFINPLLNVVLGVLVLGERLNMAQKFAVGLAAVGVLYLAIIAGRPPWIALVLAASSGGYGLIRKVVKVEAVPGLATETLLLAPFAVVFLAWCAARGTGVHAFGDEDRRAAGLQRLDHRTAACAVRLRRAAHSAVMVFPS